MKYKNSLVIILVLFAFCACKKIKDIVPDISMSVTKTGSYTVPAIPFVPPGGLLPAVSSTFSIEEDIKTNGANADLAKEATLDKFTLTIPESSNEDFGFMKSIEIRISSNNNPEEVLLAHLHNIPANAGKTLDLVSTNISLLPYVKDGTFTLKTTVAIDEPTTSSIPVNMVMNYKVTAGALDK